MRSFAAVIICAAVAAGLLWRYAIPHGPPKHLAPEGTFFLTERVAKQVDYGIYSVAPGSKVQRVSQDGAVMKVTDGHETFELTPAQLTNDLDLASALAATENEDQKNIDSVVEAERRDGEEKKRNEDLVNARKMEEYQKKRKESEKAGSTILNRPAYDQREDVTGKTIYIDKYGGRFWVDESGQRHYL